MKKKALIIINCYPLTFSVHGQGCGGEELLQNARFKLMNKILMQKEWEDWRKNYKQ